MADLELLKRLYSNTATAEIANALNRSLNSVYAKANILGLKKSEAYLASPDACRLRRGDNVGMACRFLPGHVPANKGIKGWDSGGRSHETRFKAGQRGNKWMPIGSYRTSHEGYLQRKVAETGYPPHDWRAVHLLLWIEHHGPIPTGYAVGFIDGNKQHVVIDNLVLLSRADLMQRNTIHRYPQELRLAIRQVARLKLVIERKRDEKQD
jgi:hypothetical protein